MSTGSITRSTLSETNKEVVKYLFILFNGFNPGRWNNQNQVFYISESGWDSIARDYPIRFGSDVIKLPICSVTRTDVELTYRTSGFKDAASYPHPSLQQKTVIVRNVIITYDVYVYEYTVEFMEALFDILFLVGGTRHVSHEYQSSVLQMPMRFSYEISDFKMTPLSVEEKRVGKGFIYEMNFSMRVYTLVGIVVDRSTSLNEVVVSVLDEASGGDVINLNLTYNL